MAAKQIIAGLSEMERAVLKSLYFNDYGQEGHGVWSWAHGDSRYPHGIAAASVPGVIGSLVKKELYSSEEYDKGQDVLWLLPLGREVMAELAQGWKA